MKLTDFPTLSAHLKGEKRARIEVHLVGPYKPSSARERSVQNPHVDRLKHLDFKDAGGIHDLVIGVCRADLASKNPLRPTRVFTLLASQKQLSTAYIANAFGLDDRQARRYMAACKLSIMLLSRHFWQQEVDYVPRLRALTLAEIRAANQRGNPCPK